MIPKLSRIRNSVLLTAWQLVISALILMVLVRTGSNRTLAAEPNEITATFSIVAVDPETGEVGAAVASKYPAVGKVVPIVELGVGAFCTQHHHVPTWRSEAIGMLKEGIAPEQVLANLLKDDLHREMRQLAIIDTQGRTAVHNPTQAPEQSRYWGAMTGRFYCCQGNTLTGSEVIIAMAKAYESTSGTLADRLMAAMEAGDEAGGDHRGRLAAGIRYAIGGDKPVTLELDVDNSSNAVRELAAKYAEMKKSSQVR